MAVGVGRDKFVLTQVVDARTEIRVWVGVHMAKPCLQRWGAKASPPCVSLL